MYKACNQLSEKILPSLADVISMNNPWIYGEEVFLQWTTWIYWQMISADIPLSDVLWHSFSSVLATIKSKSNLQEFSQLKTEILTRSFSVAVSVWEWTITKEVKERSIVHAWQSKSGQWIQEYKTWFNHVTCLCIGILCDVAVTMKNGR